MRQFMADVRGAAEGGIARQVGLLLLLLAALAGFFLLLSVLVPLVSSGPEDIFAVRPSDAVLVGLPSGVGFVSLSVAFVSVALGLTMVLVTQRRPLRLSSFRSLSVPAVAGTLVAATLIAVGVYIAISGTLGEGVSYDRHPVERSRLQPVGLAVLSGLFLLVTIVGVLKPRLLLPLLLLGLLAALLFWRMDCSAIDGLQSLSGAGAGIGDEMKNAEETAGPNSALEDREKALLEWDSGGASVFRLENGGAIVTQDGLSHLIEEPTTRQATKSSPAPVFEVTGAAHTGYLRTSVGDVYEGGRWRQLDPVSVPYSGLGSIGDSVRESYDSPANEFSELPIWRRSSAFLFGLSVNRDAVTTDRIDVRPTGGLKEFSAGPVPTSLSQVDTTVMGHFRPFSATFSTKSPVTSYSWTSNIAMHSDAQYAAAVPSSDPTYTQLPAEVPTRIRQLALEVTKDHATTYEKSKALESHLRSHYTYSFANGTGEGQPTPGQDPVDWFLFDYPEGTCGIFSTAFVVMARSIGIPARVVSGWVVTPTAETQIVRTDQAHQWAEVAFEGLGWVRFEPTAEGGAPSRLLLADDSLGQEPQLEPPATDRLDTVTTITEWPTQMRRQKPFAVGGLVHTAAGDPVDGMVVEVYINETKEHGGIKIGDTETHSGNFEAEVQLPAGLNLMSYQLLARAVPNDQFEESWSDPDITVVSTSGFEITGPSEVPVGVEAVFWGRLSEDTGEGAGNREVTVTVDGSSAPPVLTGPDGRFSFSRRFSDPGPHWVEVAVQREEYLLDNSARLNFVVILPTQTTVFVPVQVDVGKQFRVTGELRDTHGEPLPGEYVSVQVGDGLAQPAQTDDSGEFEVATEVDDAGEFLVRATFDGDAPVLPSEATDRLLARHAVELTLDIPSGLPQAGETTLSGRVTSETLSPIGQLELVIQDAEGDQLDIVTTANDGSFEFTVPESKDLLGSPIAFTYRGNDLNLPSSYFISIHMTSPGFNWPFWIGLPTAAVAAIVAGLAIRRVRTIGLPHFVRRHTVSVDTDTPPEDSRDSKSVVQVADEPVSCLQPVQLALRFEKDSPDLPDIWGVGEVVHIETRLSASDGRAIGRASVAVSVSGAEAATELETDEAGTCTHMWTAAELGEYEVSAQFSGNDDHEPGSDVLNLRVVDFREEIVRLYNVFLDWAQGVTTQISEQSTPREVELILVAEGLGVDQKSLDEFISRFEEADYSEHPITRRHYEAAYRAWHTISTAWIS